MGDLAALAPAAGLLPIEAGSCRLEAHDPGGLTLVAPFRGQRDAVASALGVAWPEPGRSVPMGAGALLWTGREEAMAVGVPAAAEGAAMSDQGDAWAVLRLSGAARADVLARLVPVDMRAATFPEGAVVRSLFGHLSAIFWAREGAVDILVFRSMAATAVHDLGRAMRGVAALGS